MIKKFAPFFLYLLPFFAAAQQNIGIGTGTPNSNAILDITATNKGLLLPRLALTATNATSPLSAFVAGMAVYNTATAGVSPNNVTPGYYFSDGSKWVRLITAADAGTLSWSLGGNAGTDPATHFFGTLDDKDLVFKRNNARAGLINVSLNNTSWGAEALNPLTNGNLNTAVGVQSLYSNLSGGSNTASGFQSLYFNLAGGNNTANGAKSLYFNQSGGDNAAIGFQSLFSNESGSYNTATGTSALLFNISGSNNTAQGFQSLAFNKAGSNATAIGYFAMRNANNTTTPFDNSNVAIGFRALMGPQTPPANNTGLANTAVGYITMQNNSGGSSNSAVGNETLLNNVDGNYNTAMGDGALKSANTSHNTALGQKAMNVTTTGNGNTGIGSRVLIANMDGAANVAAGYEALGGNISGNNNTATGTYTLKLNTTGSNNSAYGYSADVISADLNNATAIGANAKVGLSNSIVLGDSTNNVKVGIGTGYPTTAKLVIKTAAGTNGIDLASSDAYAEMRIIRNTLGVDKKLYLGFNALPGSAINLYSEGLTPTMTVTGGNVGIGTEVPAQKLDVNGNVNISGAIINEAFQVPALLNSWVIFGAGDATPGYYKDKEGRVHLKGTIKGGTSALLFFLPPGYRPVGMLNFIVDNNFSPLTLRVGNDGGVTLGSGYNNSALSLNGVSFRAEQ